MYSFYVVRGWKLEELASLTYMERIFLHCSREEYYKEETEKIKAIVGD